MRHAFVDIELDGLSGLINRLIEANHTAWQNLFGSTLNERGRKALREVAVDGGSIRIHMVPGIGISQGSRPKNSFAGIKDLGVRQDYQGVAYPDFG